MPPWSKKTQEISGGRGNDLPSNHQTYIYIYIGGGFKYFLFSSLLGEDFQFD